MFEAIGLVNKSQMKTRSFKDEKGDIGQENVILVTLEFVESELSDEDLVTIARNQSRNVEVAMDGTWKARRGAAKDQVVLDKVLVPFLKGGDRLGEDVETQCVDDPGAASGAAADAPDPGPDLGEESEAKKSDDA